jgi:hypothetical protein
VQIKQLLQKLFGFPYIFRLLFFEEMAGTDNINKFIPETFKPRPW